ncbi:unnamed protein product [Durusdinium trenchii]|uniref:Tubulin-specific chaperone A n=1 Tax=Durusdinium trenchii TaxID=1381693 RepID=A0ABP0LXP0_9DINO
MAAKARNAHEEVRRLEEENAALRQRLQADPDLENSTQADKALHPGQSRLLMLRRQLLKEEVACEKTMRYLTKQQNAIMAFQRHGRTQGLEALLAETESFLEGLPDPVESAQRAAKARQALWQILSNVLEDAMMTLKRLQGEPTCASKSHHAPPQL